MWHPCVVMNTCERVSSGGLVMHEGSQNDTYISCTITAPGSWFGVARDSHVCGARIAAFWCAAGGGGSCSLALPSHCRVGCAPSGSTEGLLGSAFLCMQLWPVMRLVGKQSDGGYGANSKHFVGLIGMS
jgi:hypothetical protein